MFPILVSDELRRRTLRATTLLGPGVSSAGTPTGGVLGGVRSRAVLASGGIEGAAEQGWRDARGPQASGFPPSLRLCVCPRAIELWSEPAAAAPGPPPSCGDWTFTLCSTRAQPLDLQPQLVQCHSFKVARLRLGSWLSCPLREGPVSARNGAGRGTLSPSAPRSQAAHCPQQCGSGRSWLARPPDISGHASAKTSALKCLVRL